MRRVSSFTGVARGPLGSSPRTTGVRGPPGSADHRGPRTTGVRGPQVENPWSKIKASAELCLSPDRISADHLTPASDVASRLRLHSAYRHQLIVPRCRLNTYGSREFSVAGPTVWNSLPDELRDPACGFDSFKQFLKTILFSLY